MHCKDKTKNHIPKQNSPQLTFFYFHPPNPTPQTHPANPTHANPRPQTLTPQTHTRKTPRTRIVGAPVRGARTPRHRKRLGTNRNPTHRQNPLRIIEAEGGRPERPPLHPLAQNHPAQPAPANPAPANPASANPTRKTHANYSCLGCMLSAYHRIGLLRI